MNRKQTLVNVFHPNTQHSFQLALAIQRAGFLNKFVTSIYYKPEKFPYHWLSALSGSPARKLTQELKRRFLDGLDPERVDQYPWFEIWRLFAERMRFPTVFQAKLMSACNYLMDTHFKKHYLESVSTIAGFSECSLRTLKEAKRRNIFCVLDQPIVHADFAYRVMKEEAELNPDFASTINYGFQPEWWRAERREEALLADMILCGSDFSKDSMVKNGVNAAKIRKIPYGVNLDRFHRPDRDKAARKKEFTVLFVGSIGQRKGIKYLLEAVRQIKAPDLTLKLVGNFSGDKTPYIKYRDLFCHVPHVPNTQMSIEFESADLFVLPSIMEGMSLVVLEAMASGLPVIVSENTGYKGIIENGKQGFVVPIRNSEVLKEKILFFYNNRDQAIEMGRNARLKAEQMSWTQYQNNIKNLFEELLAGRGA